MIAKVNKVMQVLRLANMEAAGIARGLRVLLLAAPEDGAGDSLERRIAAQGAQVERLGELFYALEAVIEDPADFGLFVMMCDGFGGLAMARRRIAMLGEVTRRVPVILISQDCVEQVFPEGRGLPVEMPPPSSSSDLRLAIQHALRERTLFRAA